MKTYKFLLVCLLSTISHGQQQTQEIKPELPELIPPSPTVAALMKYEEIPVSNYTGIPEISIPMINYKMPSNDISLNIGLSYHTASTKLDEFASDIGLGWSLTGTGTISRTVRGMPDEVIQAGTKYGVYRTNEQTQNNYYKALAVLLSPNPQSYYNLKEFFWETDAKGKYDTQHDLWQFNFFGHSGRFIIEKQLNGQLSVELLENSTLKIINHYIEPNSATNYELHYKPTGFTIYDDLGYKYEFNIVETSQSTSFSESIYHNNAMNSSISNYDFISSFHLSKVYDRNNNVLLEYIYLDPVIEQTRSTSYLDHYNLDNSVGMDIQEALTLYQQHAGANWVLGLYKPMQSASSNTISYGSKKISEIRIQGVGIVYFEYQTGRQDEDYFNRNEVLVLKKIIQKNLNNEIINGYEFAHTYFNAIRKKLFLEKIFLIGANNNFVDYYMFSYKEPRVDLYNPVADYWGFLKSSKITDIGHQRETDPNNVSSFALEKMILPTKGSVVFEYESNTYSAIGDNTMLNFDENPYNWDNQISIKNFYTVNNNLIDFFQLNDTQDVFFSKEVNFETNDWEFRIYKDISSPQTYVGSISSYSTSNLEGIFIIPNLQPGNYLVEFRINDIPINPVTYNSKITAFFKTKKTTDYKNFLYGGGFRVSSISTYETDVNVNNIQSQPLTKKIFDYNFFVNNDFSSGSLVSKKPIFKYSIGKTRPEIRVDVQDPTDNSFNILLERTFSYEAHTNKDLMNRNKTKGADLGYKNVKVFQSNNGFTQYTYLSPLDYQDADSTVEPLFLTSTNYDYKRGHLIKEEVFDANFKKSLEKEYNYEFDDYEIITGLNVFGTYLGEHSSCDVYKLFHDYNNYIYNKTNNFDCLTTDEIFCGVDFPYRYFAEDLHVGHHEVKEAFGWAKLTFLKTKEYFYNNSQESVISKEEHFEYNPLNKKISTLYSTDSQNQITLKHITYFADSSTNIQNRISDIEQIQLYRNGSLVSTSKINYDNSFTGNSSYLPKTIKTSKGLNLLEDRVQYDKYDEFGNVLQLSKENGNFISYIWGYNKTQPVAKLENIAYANIPVNLISDIQTFTNSPTATETQIIAALNALRSSTDVNMQKAMITTFTFKPLVGVSTITDPKGDKITYIYDDFNRLKEVRDKNNNILSENEYHYRTQN